MKIDLTQIIIPESKNNKQQTLGALIASQCNFAPASFASKNTNLDFEMVNDLRCGIIQKANKETADFRPDEIAEIKTLLSATITPNYWAKVRALLNEPEATADDGTELPENG